MQKEIEKQRLNDEEERARRTNSEFNTQQNQLLNDNQDENFEQLDLQPVKFDEKA